MNTPLRVGRTRSRDDGEVLNDTSDASGRVTNKKAQTHEGCPRNAAVTRQAPPRSLTPRPARNSRRPATIATAPPLLLHRLSTAPPDSRRQLVQRGTPQHARAQQG